jgi:Flp pilus assembly protein TadG
MKPLISFWRDCSGSAAVETVLIMPISLALMFGAADLGNYFYKEHIVIGAVRDGARFAARQQFDFLTCAFENAAATGNIKKATRLVSPVRADAAANRRIGYWDDDNTVTVTPACEDSTGHGGMYTGFSTVPRVRVDAEVGYRSLFTALGLSGLELEIRASSEAAVMGG